MNFAVGDGAEIIIMPRFVLDDALKLIDQDQADDHAGVPTMFIAMLNHPKIKSFDLSSLKFCLSGGAPLPLEVKREVRDADRAARWSRATACRRPRPASPAIRSRAR